MAERIVYSALCSLDGGGPDRLEPLVAMAGLWASHLRGPGRFDGRLLLLTNVPGLRVEGAEPIAAPIRAADRRDLFLERVRRFRRLPVGPGDRVLQMDLDALAVAPIAPLFEAIRPGVLLASPSRLPPLAADQAGTLLTAGERRRYRALGWGRRPGVSACLTACDGASWPRLMGRWAAAIRSRCRGRPVPPLGDQSFLNVLFLTGAVPVRRFPRGLIHHVRRPGEPLDDPAAVRAAVLHFPTARRLEEMRRRSLA